MAPPSAELADTGAGWPERICAAWQRSVDAIIETGRLIAEAKTALPHGEFLDMVERELPFGRQTAHKLMTIGADGRLTDVAHVRHLPPSWGTLYELTKLDDTVLETLFEDGTIRPDMERQQIVQSQKKERRAERERDLGAKQRALPEKRYGVIYADPEWRMEPWSRETGLNKAPDNHYPTSPTEEIALRPVGDIAADDAVLFLWATPPMLDDAIIVMGAWDFAYVTCIVWRKLYPGEQLGTGYWFRFEHELLLIGKRGAVPAPAPGTQWRSVIEAPVGRHSEKPAIFRELIDEYFPSLPKIELNYRDDGNGPPDGWDVWGFEAGSPEPDAQHPEASNGRGDGAEPRTEANPGMAASEGAP